MGVGEAIHVDPNPFVPGASIYRPVKAALGEVIRHVTLETAVIVVAAGPGSGKTLLADLVERTCSNMGLSVARFDRGELIRVLDGESKNVLLVDQADSITTADLEAIQTAPRPATSIILLGLPSFIARLGHSTTAAVVQISRLSASDARNYLLERATEVGRPDLFAPYALDLLEQFSAGVPRTLQTAASVAYRHSVMAGATQITPNHVLDALLQIGVDGKEQPLARGPAAVAPVENKPVPAPSERSSPRVTPAGDGVGVTDHRTPSVAMTGPPKKALLSESTPNGRDPLTVLSSLAKAAGSMPAPDVAQFATQAVAPAKEIASNRPANHSPNVATDVPPTLGSVKFRNNPPPASRSRAVSWIPQVIMGTLAIGATVAAAAVIPTLLGGWNPDKAISEIGRVGSLTVPRPSRSTPPPTPTQPALRDALVPAPAQPALRDAPATNMPSTQSSAKSDDTVKSASPPPKPARPLAATPTVPSREQVEPTATAPTRDFTTNAPPSAEQNTGIVVVDRLAVAKRAAEEKGPANPSDELTRAQQAEDRARATKDAADLADRTAKAIVAKKAAEEARAEREASERLRAQMNDTKAQNRQLFGSVFGVDQH
jgi:hypothetical protein